VPDHNASSARRRRADEIGSSITIPRPNEMALASLLEANRKSRVKFVVIAGHIHNYERFRAERRLSTLVSGGGGATPYPVERNPRRTLIQDSSFPQLTITILKFAVAGEILKGTNGIELAKSWAFHVGKLKDTFEVLDPKNK